ncbi:MAG: ABC transporter substrate-binding protein [Phormidesmis sp.]
MVTILAAANAWAQKLIDKRIGKRRLRTLGYRLLVVVAMMSAIACSSAVNTNSTTPATTDTPATESLMVLWDKGYVVEEDEAIEKVVEDWEAQGGLPVKLSFYNSGETAPKTLRVSQSGSPPDVLFAAKSVYPVSDWEGKLADVTDVVAPLADSYTEGALQAAKIYGSEKISSEKAGDEKGGDRYYAVPLNQSTTHIYYWKDLLAEAGYQPTDIPTEWTEFWSFWKTVQDKLIVSHPDLRSIGLPYSVPALDTYHVFEHVLVAHDIELLDQRGDLRLEDPEVKAGIVKSLEWYLQFYTEGYVPEDAVNWLDPDNNRNLLNRNVVMTPNPTMSIPAAVRNDPDIYFNKLATMELPNKLSGEPLPHFVDIRLAVIFKGAPHQQTAKDFLSYLTGPEILSRFLKTSYGRFMPPAISQIESDSFWQDTSDPHISTVVQTVLDGQTQPSYNALNPAYGVVMEENVWGQAIHTMAVEGQSAEAAADKAIERIQTIFREYS